jgi:hypothetical protein
LRCYSGVPGRGGLESTLDVVPGQPPSVHDHAGPAGGVADVGQRVRFEEHRVGPLPHGDGPGIVQLAQVSTRSSPAGLDPAIPHDHRLVRQHALRVHGDHRHPLDGDGLATTTVTTATMTDGAARARVCGS